jgi:hypothetical protein
VISPKGASSNPKSTMFSQKKLELNLRSKLNKKRISAIHILISESSFITQTQVITSFMANLAKLKDTFKKWVLRYAKYNVIGLTVFALNIVLYVFLFNFLGEWTYILVSVNGGIIEFALISYFNKTKKGRIFDSCSPIDNK